MSDILIWLYYAGYGKHSLGAVDIEKILILWKNSRKEWVAEKDNIGPSIYPKILDNYNRSIEFLEKYMI